MNTIRIDELRSDFDDLVAAMESLRRLNEMQKNLMERINTIEGRIYQRLLEYQLDWRDGFPQMSDDEIISALFGR